MFLKVEYPVCQLEICAMEKNEMPGSKGGWCETDWVEREDHPEKKI